ncbi:MAG TPA: TetR/AcrR family transcriptional regulator [Gemmatimonadales bacterium]|nr:TetR/AcrR family transcriptional regulator [Gemmatimonadales bacterium]
MVRPRFDNLDPERQEALMEAAAQEFGDRVYDSASLNRIIERAGMSKGSLYYYFDDKGDLFSTVMERATTLLVRLVGGIDLDSLTAETFWPSIEAMVRRSEERLNTSAWYVRLARSFYRFWGRTGDRGPAARFFAWVAGWVENVLRRGQALGAVRSDLPLDFLTAATMALGQATDRWILERWDELSAAERDRMVTAQMGLFRRLLEPEAAS